jgi:hypothetical protein
VADPAPGDETPEDEEEEKEKPTRLGKFIQTYSAFLSSFVIGIAGLIATSIWQYKQSEIARRQAESQQKVAESQAANSWRIERAEILSKNLQILSAHGAGTLEQRYGVLLSLTRGNILDPELAVSYALELGKENTEYMRSVLSSTADKSYAQLAHAFQLTCVQRFGVARDVDLCKNDRYSDRSDALAQLISDEMEAASNSGTTGPLGILRDERSVQALAQKLAWLFEPYLQQLYDRRQWNEIARFEGYSTGARLVAALVLSTSRTGEFVTAAEANDLNRFHGERRKWLTQYLFGVSCDGECKGKLIDVMLSSYGEAQGDYDDALRKLIERPRNEAGPSVGRVHARLLWCQIDPDDENTFRDHVLAPAVMDAAAQPKLDGAMLDDLTGLLALVPEPSDYLGLTAWKVMLGKLQKINPDRYQKAYVGRRAIADRERRDPPPAMKNVSFCGAPSTLSSGPALPSPTDE